MIQHIIKTITFDREVIVNFTSQFFAYLFQFIGTSHIYFSVNEPGHRDLDTVPEGMIFKKMSEKVRFSKFVLENASVKQCKTCQKICQRRCHKIWKIQFETVNQYQNQVAMLTFLLARCPLKHRWCSVSNSDMFGLNSFVTIKKCPTATGVLLEETRDACRYHLSLPLLDKQGNE